ncbi:MAG: hypothetical protein LBF22_13160 [Deltaproteobacteria bacterium]|jgi:hypothetical protein|nr:hypothetical protein [Deltaproteobacteria bacterium]
MSPYSCIPENSALVFKLKESARTQYIRTENEALAESKGGIDKGNINFATL